MVFDHVLPNVPGKSMRGVLVVYPAGGASAAHTHPHSAFIYATVLEGAVTSQVNDGPVTVYQGRRELRGESRRPPQCQPERQRYPARAPSGGLRRGYGGEEHGDRRPEVNRRTGVNEEQSRHRDWWQFRHGLAAARSFAAAGAKVVITGRRSRPLEAAVSNLPISPPWSPMCRCRKMSNARSGDTVNTFGRMDVLVNNAGAGAILSLADVTARRIEEIFAVNVVGPSLLAAAALPYLAASKGAIVNVSSTYGHRPIAGVSHYAASKAALEQLTRCWALELAPLGIRVNSVAAGPTESGALTGMMGLSRGPGGGHQERERERIPLKRRGDPDDVARWILRSPIPPPPGSPGR